MKKFNENHNGWLECQAINITLLKTALESNWEHVEKVNAHLVMED